MRRFSKLFLLGAIIVVLTSLNASAAGITEQQAEAILNELKQIRLLLEKQQAPNSANAVRPATPYETAKITVGDIYALGANDAPVTLVEFTDYQCPFCNQFHRLTFPELKKTYIDTGKIRFISRDLPLEFHNNALLAARAARCAGEQDKYWELRHVLSSNPNNLSKQAILNYAQDLSLDTKQFQACLDSEKYREEVQKDVMDAQSIGITGTPGFVLGRSSKHTLEGIKIVGAQPFTLFDAKIKELLAGTPH
ncbi:MAG TPA: thioredoxin domain-containing protein [Nitrospiraceae bacterium]|nr:thioredoxin domain-containing protein [Nitrospiraceae bacterium]